MTKKIISILCALAVIMSLGALFTFFGAAAKPVFTAANAASEPNINDGKMDSCYESSTKITFAAAKGGATNDSYVYFVNYDGDLYVYAYVKDTDGSRGTTNHGVNDYKYLSYSTDCFEIYLNLDMNETGTVKKNNYSCQLRVNPWYEVDTVSNADGTKIEYKDKLGLPQCLQDGPMSEILGISSGKTKAVVTPKGNDYIVEMHIALDGYGASQIGFGVQVQEGESEEEGDDKHKSWNSDSFSTDYYNTSMHETLNLTNYKRNPALVSSTAASSIAASSKITSSAVSSQQASSAAASSVSDASSSSVTSSKATSSEVASSEADSQVSPVADTDTNAGAVDDNEKGKNSSVWVVIGVAVGVGVLAGIAAAAVLMLKGKKAEPSVEDGAATETKEGTEE